ncbi:hypothetical protein C8Q73DRAFT_789434 [Cubamyces lactineus]|nr:hypothetical protein C8Q73DRAFT_789434 [Cubamyces lactineus]
MVHQGVRVPFKHFADVFWPLPEGLAEPPIPAGNPFFKMTDPNQEKVIASFFRQAVVEHNLTPGMVLCVSPNLSDVTPSDADGKPGEYNDNGLNIYGAFLRDNVSDIPAPVNNRPHRPDQVVAIEFKREDTGVDPFSDGADPIPAAYWPKARHVVFSMFVIIGNLCRITRWDRTGVIFTVSINYHENWRMFCKALWRMQEGTVKDFWRADYLRVQHEGQILQDLNDANVPCVPTVLCYDDLAGQQTVTPAMWDWAKD